MVSELKTPCESIALAGCGVTISLLALVQAPSSQPDAHAIVHQHLHSVNLEMQCQMFGVPYTPVPSPDRWLADDEALACGCGVALHTPGHTPGSMSFWFA